MSRIRILHDHLQGIRFKSGSFIINNKKIKFNEGQIFLFVEGLNNEQHVCLSLLEKLDQSTIHSSNNVFVTLELDEKIMVGTIPIQKIPIFLLSATVEQNNIDALVSPRIKIFDRVLPRTKK